MDVEFIAHQRESDGKIQTVYEHLNEVAAICSQLTSKIGLPEVGKLLGLLHDFGKYSHDFQTYIKSVTDLLDPDIDDDYVDSKGLKGKIDHSTAGAQWVWQKLGSSGEQGMLIAQILAVCLASHHGGLFDCLLVNGKNGFQKRISKKDADTHHHECLNTCDKEIVSTLNGLASNRFFKDIWKKIVAIVEPQKNEAARLVAPRAGAWIETKRNGNLRSTTKTILKLYELKTNQQ